MANEEQLSILKQGVDAWNKWRQRNQNVRVDLSQIKLKDVNLNGVDFRDINLSDANFWNVDLVGAHLWRVNMMGAYISQVNLQKADLMDVYLRGAELHGVNLKGAYLNGASFGETTLVNLDLSEVVGLDEIMHYYPSFISIDILQTSKGKIPLGFLRGCGLSDIQIEYAKLMSQGLDPEQVTDITYRIHQLCVSGVIQYYSCFISYSSKNHEFAKQLHNDLQNNGVRCWFAPEDMKIGDQIRPTIDRQIRLRDKLLVILSENSINSEWVGDEVEAALEEESKSDRLVLFPIRLDDSVMNAREDWAAKIKRRRHIGDFSNWKDKNSYQKAFERLLRDLKATE